MDFDLRVTAGSSAIRQYGPDLAVDRPRGSRGVAREDNGAPETAPSAIVVEARQEAQRSRRIMRTRATPMLPLACLTQTRLFPGRTLALSNHSSPPRYLLSPIVASMNSIVLASPFNAASRVASGVAPM